MADNEEIVRIKAVADFTNLKRVVLEARNALKELREEEALLNAQSVKGSTDAAKARDKNRTAAKNEAAGIKESTAATKAQTTESNKSATSIGKQASARRENAKATGTEATQSTRLANAKKVETAAVKAGAAASKSEAAANKDVQAGLGSLTEARKGNAAAVNSESRARTKNNKAISDEADNLNDSIDWKKLDTEASDGASDAITKLAAARKAHVNAIRAEGRARTSNANSAEKETKIVSENISVTSRQQGINNRAANTLERLAAARKSHASALRQESTAMSRAETVLNRYNTAANKVKLPATGDAGSNLSTQVFQRLASVMGGNANIGDANTKSTDDNSESLRENAHEAENAGQKLTGLGGILAAVSKAWGGHSRSVDKSTSSTVRFRGGLRDIISDLGRTKSSATGLTGSFDNMGKSFQRLARMRPHLMPSFAALVPIVAGVISALGPLVSLFGAVGAAGLGLASNLAQLSGVALALPGIFGAAAAGVGALLTAFSGVGNVFKAYGKSQQAAAGGSAAVGKSAAETAQDIKRASEDISDAQLGVSRAYEDAAENVSDAETAYAKAQKASTRATLDLNKAREEALKDLQDLRTEVSHAELDEAEAIAALTKARENYNDVMADPGSTLGDKQTAAADVGRAEADLADVREQNTQNQKDLTEAEKKGVEGSDKVVDAKQAQADAIEDESDALRDLQRAQQDSSRTILEANRRLEDSYKALYDAQHPADTGGGGGTSAIDAYQAALDKLSPSAKAVVLALIGMKDAWHDVQQAVSEAFFSKIVGDVQNLDKFLPTVQYLLEGAAGALGDLASKGIKMVTSGPWTDDFHTIADNNVTVITNLGNAGLSFMQALKDIMVAAGPFTDWLTGKFAEGAANFAAFVATGRESGSLATWLKGVQKALEQWYRIVKNIVGAIVNYGSAAGEFGQWITDGFEAITQGWLDASEQAKKTDSPFKNWLEDIKPLLSQLKDLIGKFFTWFGETASDPDNINKMTALLKSITDDLGPALSDLIDTLSKTDVAQKLVDAVTAIVNALDSFDKNGGTAAFSAFFGTLKTFFDAISTIVSMPGLGPIITTLGTGLGVIAALNFVGVFTPLTNMLGILMDTAKNGKVSELFGKLKNIGIGAGIMVGGQLLSGAIPDNANYDPNDPNSVDTDYLKNSISATTSGAGAGLMVGGPIGAIAGGAAGALSQLTPEKFQHGAEQWGDIFGAIGQSGANYPEKMGHGADQIAGAWNGANQGLKDFIGPYAKSADHGADQINDFVKGITGGLNDFFGGNAVNPDGTKNAQGQSGLTQLVGGAATGVGNFIGDTGKNMGHGADQIGSFFGGIGNGLNDFFGGNGVNPDGTKNNKQSGLSTLVGGAANGVGSFFGGIGNGIGGAASKAAGEAGVGINGLVGGAQNGIGDFFKGIFGDDSSKLPAGAGGGGKGRMGASVGAPDDGLGNGLISDSLKNITKMFTDGIDWIKNTVFKPIGDGFNTAISWIQTNIFQPVEDGFNAAISWLQTNIFQPIGDGFNTVLSWVQTNIFQPIGDAYLAASQWVQDNIFTPIGTAYLAAIQWVQDNIFTPVGAAYLAAIQWINDNIFTPVLNAFNAAIGWIQNNIFIPIQNAFNAAIGWIQNNIFIPIQNAFNNAIAWIQNNVFAPILNGFNNVLNWMQNNVFGPIGSAFNNAINWINNNVFGPIGTAFNNAINWIQNSVFGPIGTYFNNVIGGIARAFSNVGSFIYNAVHDALGFIASLFSGGGQVKSSSSGGGTSNTYASQNGGSHKLATGGKVGTEFPVMNYLAKGGRGKGFKKQGTDTVAAMLTPGEVVIRKAVVDAVGVDKLLKLNAGLISYQDLLTEYFSDKKNVSKQKPTDSGIGVGGAVPLNPVSHLAGGGLAGNNGYGASPAAASMVSSSVGTQNNSTNSTSTSTIERPTTIENLNVYNPVAEPVGISLPNAVRKVAYLGNQGDDN